MKLNLLLCHYNNYSNRKLKIENQVEDYFLYQIGLIENFYFNPNDGVSTEVVLNWDGDIPDYLIALQQGTQEINSRWFVMDAIRTRNGQFKVILQRDLIADYYQQVVRSICYIEKGFASKNNPIIFNKEGVPFNEVKREEKLLYDRTKTPWIVCYFDRTYPKEPAAIKATIQKYPDKNLDTFPLLDLITDESGQVITDTSLPVKGPIDWYNTKMVINIGSYKREKYPLGTDIHAKEPNAGLVGYFNTIYHNIQSNSILVNGSYQFTKSGLIQKDDVTLWNDDTYNHVNAVYNYSGDISLVELNRITKDYKKAGIDFKTYKNLIATFFPSTNRTDIIDGANAVGTYKSKDGKIYEISVRPQELYYRNVYIGAGPKPNKFDKDYIESKLLYDTLNQEYAKIKYYGNVKNTITQNYGNSMLKIQVAQPIWRFFVREVKFAATEISSTIQTEINALKDAPYKMIAIPYDAKVKVGADTLSITPDVANSISQMLIENLQPQQGGSGFMYDVQLLPYCPQEDWFTIDNDGTLILKSDLTEGIDYTLVKDKEKNVGVMIHALRSKFTFNIPLVINTDKYDSIEFKVNRETTKYRIVSPNFANFSNFDPFMNGGVHSINVDCTYKPMTPYIKLNIDYAGLYGADFNDDRGLICGGDFSIPMISNSWMSYQIQNKNYANIFERETQHIETDFKISQNQKLTMGAFNSALMGAGGVAAAGMGNATAAIGAAGGAITNLASTFLSADYSKQHFDENMDYRKDMYQFNLQNVQAKPQGLVRTSAFNFNNKLVPFIERYEATDIERQMLTNKLKYNGMTINAISSPASFLDGSEYVFFKGRIIQIEGIFDDSHIVSAIDHELNLGLLMKIGGDNNGEEQ